MLQFYDDETVLQKSFEEAIMNTEAVKVLSLRGVMATQQLVKDKFCTQCPLLVLWKCA
jgi:hypothetical protein